MPSPKMFVECGLHSSQNIETIMVSVKLFLKLDESISPFIQMPYIFSLSCMYCYNAHHKLSSMHLVITSKENFSLRAAPPLYMWINVELERPDFKLLPVPVQIFQWGDSIFTHSGHLKMLNYLSKRHCKYACIDTKNVFFFKMLSDYRKTALSRAFS